MAIGNHNDLTHIVRTSDQWKNTYDKYELIPNGVLCVELVSSDVTKIKIGDGHNIFSKLPYIGDLDLSKYYTKLETDTRIKEILSQEKVVRIKGILNSKSDLPADARCGDIYFVRQLSSSDNKYIEYIYSPDNTWEPLGGIPVDIDLSEYAKTAYVDDKIEQVNERIDDIEQHGTHTHPNKEILDQITEPYTTADKETLASLHNYDDTEIREMISQSSHTHANKEILDATSAAFTREDKSKLDQLNPYDDSVLKEKITALERLAHEHSNKRILDQTTASFTKEYERKMRWIRIYTGCTGMEEGIAGLVPAAQAGEEDYVLSGSGEWVPQTGGGGTYTLPIATASTLGGIKVGDGLSIDPATGVLSATGGGSGGDSIAEGGGITITTDPQTGVKTISVNTGDNLEVDPDTGELNITGVDYTAGKGIYIGADYRQLEYIKNSGNYDQIILTDIMPKFSDKLEMDIKFGAASNLSTNKAFIGRANYGNGVVEKYGYTIWCDLTSSNSNLGFYNKFIWTAGMPNSNMLNYPAGMDYTGTNSVRTILTMQDATASWGETTLSFSNCIDNTFIEVIEPIALFGQIDKNDALPYDCGEITLYGVKWYNSNNVLIHNLIPVERVMDDEIGLYDTITDTFYSNSGNGSFIKGPYVSDDSRVINAKIGNGLDFDSNNAIEVVTGDGLTVNQDNELEVSIGNGLQINQDGEVEIDPSIIPEAAEYSSGEAITIRDVSQILPAGYVEVDYIEGIGNYTVINYIPNRKTKIVGTASQTQTSYDPVLFGNRTGSNGQQFVFWFNRYDSTQAKVGFVYGTNTWSTSSDCDNGKLIPYTLEDQFTFLISLDDEFNINDSFVHNITENGAPASNLKLGIFALVNSSSDEIESSDQIFRGRMYEFKIYEDDELVVNLIPAVSTSTNQSGFYDVINDIFYTSKTATPFGYDPSTIHSTGKVIDVNYGNGLTVNQNNELEVNIGDGLSFDANGAIQADAQPLSPATDSTLGGVIIGEGINVDEYGEISLSAGEGLDIDFESPLPSEYTLVKGISSVGHNDLPYINTGYLIKPTSRIIVRGALYKTTSGWAFPIGVRHNNYSNPVMFCTRHDHNGDSIELWLPNDTLIASAADREKCYNDPVIITISSDGLNIENETTGEVVTLTTSDTLPTATLPLYVFATNDNSTISFPGSMDLYRLQIFEGTTKVLDYLPCKRNSDNKYGVYDIVAHEYKTSSNVALFEPVAGTPSGDDLIQQIKLLPATANTIGGVKQGDGILVDNDGTISVDPTIIPEVPTYEDGTAISIEDVEHGGVTFDAWNSGTGWENVCYTYSTGNSVVNYQYEAHSPISNSYTLPTGATHIRAISYDQNDTMLWTSFSWIDSNNYHFASTSPEDGHYNDWFEIPTGAVKVNFGVRHSKLNNTTAMSLNDIKSVDITVQTVSEIEVDVWNSGTGWLNGNYYSGNSSSFTTSWYYSYHSNPDAYIPIPNGATHVMVMGISNENDSHFEGGGVNVFSAESHSNHIYWWGCAWQWHEISSDAKFVQIDVKWNNNNTRTISGSDIKSVTLVWKLPALEINQSINVKYGDGLTVNQNNELEVNLGSGLQFDANGAIEVVGGGGSGGNGDYTAGDAIEFRPTQLSFNVDAIRWDISNIKSTSQTSGPWTQVRYIEFCDDSGTPYTISSASGIWEDNTSITYSTTGGSQTINDMIANTQKMCAIWRYPDHTMQLTFNLDTAVPCADIAKFRIKLGDDVPERDPKSWKVYFRDASTQIWYVVQDIANAELSDTRDIWSNYYPFDITGATSINVKYGTGLAIDPITGELFVDGQLPEGTIIKKMTYIGDGGATNNIQFEKKPIAILSIYGAGRGTKVSSCAAPIDAPVLNVSYGTGNGSNSAGMVSCTMSYNDTTNVLSLTGGNDPGVRCNMSGETYTVYYLIKGHTEGGTSATNEVSVVKTFTYVGTGTMTNNIQFPETPDMLLSIAGPGGDNTYVTTTPTPINASKLEFAISDGNNNNGVGGALMSFDDTTNVLTLTSSRHVSWAFNTLDTVYQVRYIVNEVIASSNYVEGDGIEIDPVTGEISVNIGTGLAFDPQTGAINVTGGGGGGGGDTVAQGNGINITTDQQTGDKVIAVNAGSGLAFDQTTHALEVSSGVVTSIAPTQNTPGSITVTEGDGTATPVQVLSQMGGATSSTAGTAGYVPAPSSGDDDAYLRGDGTWDDDVVTENDLLTLVFVPDDYTPPTP